MLAAGASHFDPVDDDAAAVMPLEPVDAADQRGLARARGSADDDLLALSDLKVDVARAPGTRQTISSTPAISTATGCCFPPGIMLHAPSRRPIGLQPQTQRRPSPAHASRMFLIGNMMPVEIALERAKSDAHQVDHSPIECGCRQHGRERIVSDLEHLVRRCCQVDHGNDAYDGCALREHHDFVLISLQAIAHGQTETGSR